MTECSNPVSCQMAKRVECTCDCNGANHGKLRQKMDDLNTKEEAEQELAELKAKQEVLKQQKRKVRRQKRAAVRKVEKE